MATVHQNLSLYDNNSVPDASSMSFGIVVSEWNTAITGKLLEGACATLVKQHVKKENIHIAHVPGSFELTFGAKQMAEHLHPDAVIVLGCVIKGETPHFDYVCSAVTQGITELNVRYDIPFIFGLLTTNNLHEAEDRCGGKLGNKGDESAITAIKMIDFSCRFKK
jgi:6,7-dimethyl-8-ribityllumazine synthase